LTHNDSFPILLPIKGEFYQSITKEVVVLHVIDERDIEHIAHLPDLNVSIEELEKRKEEYAKEEMKAIETELKNRGFNVKTWIDKRVPFRDILQEEEEEKDVSVVVLGSHGKSNIKEMLLSSESEKVIRKSKKPVLVVKR
jgi:nucleotide-binding universal stress UspA family protein